MKMCAKCKDCKNKCKYHFAVDIQSFYCPKFEEKDNKGKGK